MATPYPYVSGAVLTAAQLNDGQNLPINDVTANYVLVNNDRYKRVIMNNAGSTTITVNNNVFVTGDIIWCYNKGAGSTVITAGAGVTVNTAGSLTLAQYGGGYLLALSASTFTFFSGGAPAYGTATGGTSSSVTVGGVNYTLLTFTSTGTLTVTRAGFFDYLLVGGGSGQLYCNTTTANGGGGAGQITQGSVYLSANTTITIGAGGAFADSNAALSAGGDTSIDGTAPIRISAAGSKAVAISGLPRVSQGSGPGGGDGKVPISYTSKQGFVGGSSNASSTYAGGGGGGQGGVGQNSPAGTTGGAGGVGIDISDFIGGSALFKASGGGGGASVTPGSGGSSLGNNGTTTAAGTNGSANTGCGGGGGVSLPTGGNGGSGIAYIRFKV